MNLFSCFSKVANWYLWLSSYNLIKFLSEYSNFYITSTMSILCYNWMISVYKSYLYFFGTQLTRQWKFRLINKIYIDQLKSIEYNDKRQVHFLWFEFVSLKRNIFHFNQSTNRAMYVGRYGNGRIRSRSSVTFFIPICVIF